jgi:hypothetical protein
MHYLRNKRVPAKLRFEIQDFYSYKFDCDMDGEGIMEDLPALLQMKLEVALKKHTIARVEIFKNIDPLAMLSILNVLDFTIALPSELLTRQGEFGHVMFVVQQGRLSVSMNSAQSTVRSRRQREKRSKDRRPVPFGLNRSLSKMADPTTGLASSRQVSRPLPS